MPKGVESADDESDGPEWESESRQFVLKISTPAVFFEKSIYKKHKEVDGEESLGVAKNVVNASNGNRCGP